MYPPQAHCNRSIQVTSSLCESSNECLTDSQNVFTLESATVSKSPSSGFTKITSNPPLPHSSVSKTSRSHLPIEQNFAEASSEDSHVGNSFKSPEFGLPRVFRLSNPLSDRKCTLGVEVNSLFSGRLTGPPESEVYHFPRDRLSTRIIDEGKVPLVIVACGSFSPPTFLHLRMFEMAKDAIIEDGKFEVVGGYFSPVSDKYPKPGLALAVHRVRMCQLAVGQTSNWLMVDSWEATRIEYIRTAVVLEHFNQELNEGVHGGFEMPDGSRKRIHVVLLAGGDLVESFGSWPSQGLHIILGRFGCVIIERTGSDVWEFLLSHEILYQYRKNLVIVKQLIYNDMSSSKIRWLIKRGMSIRFLLPSLVVRYIEGNHLYNGPETAELGLDALR